MAETTYLRIIPVRPSADIPRDVAWYRQKLDMSDDNMDNMYAVLYRDEFGFYDLNRNAIFIMEDTKA